MRRFAAAALLITIGSAGAGAQQRGAERLLFTPSPLGAASEIETNKAPLARRSAASPAAVPMPRARPGTSAPVATVPTLRVDLAGATPHAFSGENGRALFAAPNESAFDFSRGLDLGGASLGVETGRTTNSGGSMDLLAPEAKDGPWTDPTLAEKRRSSSPFLGLSLSAPTN